jgi:imidazolonepropionase-like amidohydrolase
MLEHGIIRIDNAHIFDGQRFLAKGSLHIQDGKFINSADHADQIIDARGGFLIPGLIDTHVHLTDVSQLSDFCKHGQTTVLDMACWPPSKMNSFRNLPRLPQILSAGIAATSPGSSHSRMPQWPQDQLLSSARQADDFVKARIAEGSDYIKVVCDDPGPLDLVRALRDSARAHGKLAIAHAARLEAFRLALDCEFDVITHVPVDAPLTVQDATTMKEKGIISTPTLIMERAMAARLGPPPGSEREAGTGSKMDWEHSRQSARLLFEAGVPILASTDANSAPFPLMPRHGSALHEELEMLHGIGMTNLELLCSATILPAKHFNLTDRGQISPGMRADLVLLEKNPLDDIKATRTVEKVWCGGELVYQSAD